MGAEPTDPQFDNLPDVSHIDLTPTWDEPDPALLDDLNSTADDVGFEPLDDFETEAFGEGFDFG